ncbi:MAG: ferritin-like domain-containing protein [Persicimonas sp.]
MAKNDNMLMKWLRDAHAMEKSAESILEKQVDRIEDYPEVHKKVEEHLRVTKRQAQRIEDCIEQLGGDTSVLKETVGKFMGAMQAFGASGADDEVVKASISNYSFECMEIASYKSLIAAAEAYNEPEVRQMCKEILAEEEEMANWLENNIDQVTQSFLSEQGVTTAGKGTVKPGPERGGEPPRPRA